MYNITLVCTHHSELGKCNSEELFKIINSLRPEVIFEELTPDLFDRFYKQNDIPFETPEIKSVKRYIKDHIVSQVPVDINVSDTLSIDQINYLFNTFNKYAVYAKLEAVQKDLMNEKGYAFLNSKKSEELIERKKSLENRLIEFDVNKYQLSRIHAIFYEEHDKRENDIIRNIYSYSERNAYKQAVLLLGSGHRKTLSEKIRKSVNHVGINFTLYGD